MSRLAGNYLVSAGKLCTGNISLDEGSDIFQLIKLFSAAYNGICSTALACTACSSDTVDIILVILGKIIVENAVNALNVNSSCGNVGSDKHVDASRLECAQHLSTARLLHIAVKSCRLEAL